METQGSTIAEMIERFRSTGPRDPSERRKEARAMKGKFWWAEQQEDASSSSVSSEVDEDEEDIVKEEVKAFRDSYDWKQPAPLSPGRKSADLHSYENLDDLIAKDVEEFARSSMELGKQLSARRASWDDDDSDDKPEQVKDAYEELAEQERQEESSSDESPSRLFDTNRAARALQIARQKLDKIGQRASLSPTRRSTEGRLQAVALESPSRRKWRSTSTSALSVVADLDTLIYNFSQRLPPPSPPNQTADPVQTEDSESQGKPVETKTSSKQVEDKELVKARIDEITKRARARSGRIDQALRRLQSSRVVDFDLDDVRSESLGSWEAGDSSDDELSEETAFDRDVGVLYNVSELYPLPPNATRTAYGSQVQLTDIPENLDIAFLGLHKRLDSNEAKEKREAAEKEFLAIENLKKSVGAKLKDYFKAEEEEKDLPPLPVESEDALKVLEARMRLANDFDRHPSLIKEEYLTDVSPEDLKPQYRALLNAFHARDWNDDGLITVQDAKFILEELSSFAGTPITVTEQQIHQASGVSLPQGYASGHFSFKEMLRIFDALMPAQIASPSAIRRKAVKEHEEKEVEFQSDASSSASESTEDRNRTKQRVEASEIRQLAKRLQRAEELLRISNQRNLYQKKRTTDRHSLPSTSSSTDSESDVSTSSSSSDEVDSSSEDDISDLDVQSLFSTCSVSDWQNIMTRTRRRAGDRKPRHRKPKKKSIKRKRTSESKGKESSSDVHRDSAKAGLDSVSSYPPPYNPTKMYEPTAPVVSAPEPSRKVGKDEVVLNLNHVRSAIQNATIDFYKKRLDTATSVQSIDPAPMRRAVVPQSLPPPGISDSVESIKEASEKENDRPLLFQYTHHPGQGGRLRVSSNPFHQELEKKHNAESRLLGGERYVNLNNSISSRRSKEENRGGSTEHFELHRERLSSAWNHLKQFESMRHRMVQRVSL